MRIFPPLRCVIAASLIGLGGCAMPDFLSFPPQVRGNRVATDDLQHLVPGTSTRTDVTALIGTPTAKDSFDDNHWLYIAQVTRPVIAGFNKVEDQQVIVMTFDGSGVLRNIDRKTMADSQAVAVVARTTPAPGSEASFIQQLLGNVGRFNAGAPATSGGDNRSGGQQAPGSDF